MSIFGDVSISGGTLSTGSGTIILDGDLAYNDTNSTNLGNVSIGDSSSTTTLTSDMVADDITVDSTGQLTTDGYEMDISGTMIFGWKP